MSNLYNLKNGVANMADIVDSADGTAAINVSTATIATATISTAIVPDASGGADIGTTSAEWGHVYIADDKKIYLGSDQDVSIEYDEDGLDVMLIAGSVTFADGTTDVNIASHDTSNGLKLGGTLVTATAAELNALDGITATVGELNLTDNMPANITFAAASAAANVCEVTITVKDAAAATIASVFNLDVWLSDAATGAGLTGTTASGTVQAKAASGADIGTYTSKKALRVQTLATGIYILEITDTAKTGFYPCATLPSTGATIVGTQLVAGNYGA